MVRVVMIVASALVACCVTAVVAVSAWAEAPEFGHCLAKTGGKYTNNVCTKAAKPGKSGFYEWEAGAVKNKFTGVGGVATLETIHGVTVSCKTEASSGEFTSPKTVGNIHVVFTGCASAGLDCKTVGAAVGEIVTNPLAGTLVWENATKKKVAIDLVPQETELFVEFQCGGPVKVKGSVLTNVPADKVVTTITEKFTAKKGKQKPEYYYTASKEKVQDVLISKIGGAGAELEQSGQTVTNVQTDEEAGEINTVA